MTEPSPVCLVQFTRLAPLHLFRIELDCPEYYVASTALEVPVLYEALNGAGEWVDSVVGNAGVHNLALFVQRVPSDEILCVTFEEDVGDLYPDCWYPNTSSEDWGAGEVQMTAAQWCARVQMQVPGHDGKGYLCGGPT